jgi:hypothetical protein
MFGFLPQDDYSKMAMRAAGMSMLAGGDPSSVLGQMPELMMNARKMEMQRKLEERKIALDEKQLEQAERRIRLEKRTQDREDRKLTDLQKMGEPMSRYNLDTTPRFEGDPLSHPSRISASQGGSTMKSDRAMPTGEEGNPFAKKMMQLPLSFRQGMAAAPLSAGEIANTAMTKGVENIFDPDTAASNPEAITLMSPDGKEFWTGDVRNPADYEKFNQLTQLQKWVKAPERQIVDQRNPKPLPVDEKLDDQMATDFQEAQAFSQKADYADEFAGYAMNPSIYTGPFGNTIKDIVKIGQGTFGMFEDVDTASITQMEKLIPAMVQQDRQTAARDSSMSNADREFWISSEPNFTDPKEGIAMYAARQRGLADYKRERIKTIMTYRKTMSASEAYDKWETENAPEARDKFLGPEAIGKRALSRRAPRMTAEEYVRTHRGSVKDKLTDTMNGNGVDDQGKAKSSKTKTINGKKYMEVDGELYEVVD